MGNKKGLIFTGAVVVVILVALAVIFFSGNKVNRDEKVSNNDNSIAEEATGDVAGAATQKSAEWIVGLAKALKEKSAVMYGAYWCSHCQNQKKEFGDAFQYVDYVECDAKGPDANPDECTAQGIEGYPTWIYQGQKYSGEQSFDKLAAIIGYTSEK